MSQDAAPEVAPAQPPRWQPSLWLVLIIAVVAVALAAVILVRIAGPLYALLFPLEAPLPGGAQEVEHARPERAAEYWIYRSTMSGLEVAAFYEAEGGTCRNMGPLDSAFDSRTGIRTVAYCTGRKQSGSQIVSWEVYIADGYPDDEGPTRFRLYRYRAN